ncbi:four helix bundle protein [Patescibacteria group bacterium]|nr:four helix bundle protein [Patescibacteria group bacterium]
MQQETSNNQKGYRRLIVWQKADELAFQVYVATKIFPREELFSLVSQMRRAAISVPANVVEGYSRSSKKEKIQFYNIAKSSLTELEYYLDFSFRLDYLNKDQYNLLIKLRNEVGKLLNGFIKSTKK